MRILEEKGHVKHHRDGARYVYLPRVSKEAASKSALRRGDERFRSSLGHAPGRRLHRRQFYKLRRLAAALLLRVASHYDPAQKYPLLCWLHGSPGDEASIVTPNTVYSNGQPLAASSPLKVFASLGRQQTDPGILLWVTRRAAQTFQKVEPASESLFPGMHDFRKTDRLEDIFEGGVVAHTVPG